MTTPDGIATLEQMVERLTAESACLTTEVREAELDLRSANVLSEARREELVKCIAENRSLTADLARVTEERELAKADALILAHSYQHDSNPPQSVVARALAYRGAALAADAGPAKGE